MVYQLVGIGEHGCPEALPPPGPGYMPVSTDAGIVWTPAGQARATTVEAVVAAGMLTITVNGVATTVQLAGLPVEDTFGVELGYFLAG